jgi:hypothetical protein
MMQTIQEIDAAIIQLESKKIEDESDLKKQLELTFEKLQPINILKSTLEEIQNSNDVKINLAQIALAYTNNILSKKIVTSTKDKPMYQLGAIALLSRCTKLANENPEWIVATAVVLFRKIFTSKK